MKKLFILSLMVFLGYGNSYSQNVLDTDGLNNLDNVYLHSLKEYCETLDSTTTKIIYVKDKEIERSSWPKKIKSFEIKYLVYGDYEKVIPKKGKITIVGISPLEYRKGKFSVGVIPFSTTRSKKSVYFSSGGGLSVYFEFDPVKKGFIYKSKEWFGI